MDIQVIWELLKRRRRPFSGTVSSPGCRCLPHCLRPHCSARPQKKAAQPQLQGEFIRGLDINQSVKVAIPVLDGIKQADSRDNGNRKRKNDFQQHSHVGGSVYFGGFFQAFRKLPEKVLITIKLNTLIACGMYREDRESYIPRFLPPGRWE